MYFQFILFLNFLFFWQGWKILGRNLEHLFDSQFQSIWDVKLTTNCKIYQKLGNKEVYEEDLKAVFLNTTFFAELSFDQMPILNKEIVKIC